MKTHPIPPKLINLFSYFHFSSYSSFDFSFFHGVAGIRSDYGNVPSLQLTSPADPVLRTSTGNWHVYGQSTPHATEQNKTFAEKLLKLLFAETKRLLKNASLLVRNTFGGNSFCKQLQLKMEANGQVANVDRHPKTCWVW